MTVWRVCCVGLLIVAGGCNMDLTPEPERTTREIAKTAGEVADAMQSIRDADTARFAMDKVDQKFSSLCVAVGRLPQLQRQAQGEGDTDNRSANEAFQAMSSAVLRLRSEYERLESLPGLPVEFWKMLDAHAIDFAAKAYDAAPPSQTGTVIGPQQFTRNTKDLFDRLGYEQVIKLDFVNVRLDLADKACEKLRQLVPSATLHEIKSVGGFNVVLGPVTDFRGFVASLDFAEVVLQNESKRSLKLKIRPMKLGAKAETVEEEAELAKKEMEENARKAQKEDEERRARALAEAEKLAAERKKEEDGGDPNDPEYFDRLAEIVMNGEHFKRQQAVQVLLRTPPSKVTSEQRKKIAKAFKMLAEEEHGFQQEDAIKGLVIWGGKYSGPILVKLLKTAQHFDEERIIKALGQIKYGKAAPLLVDKLGDWHMHKVAFEALREMGEEAEDALLVVAPTSDADICLAAVQLLGDCGTAKSLPILRKGTTSRNWRVRDASKESIRKIMARKNGAKPTQSEEEE